MLLSHSNRVSTLFQHIIHVKSRNVITKLCSQQRFNKISYGARKKSVQGLPGVHTVHEGIYAQLPGVPINKDQTLLVTQVGYAKMITFNNERFFNRWNEEQLEELFYRLRVWNHSPRTKFLIFKGMGAGFFSAGLDPRAILRHIENGDQMAAAQVLRQAFKFAYTAANCETPTATVINGVMMGAGATIGIHANYAMVTPGAAFATPEVTYGYTPDCGNTYNLSLIDAKHPGAGTFIGMTGSIIRSTDLLCTGLGSHYVGSAGAGREILELLRETPEGKVTSETVDQAVRFVVEDNRKPLSFSQDLYAMKQIFSGNKTFKEFMDNLRYQASDSSPDAEVRILAQKTLRKFSQMSPTAVKVTHRAMVLAQGKDMATCMQNEYRAAVRLMQRSKDYYNGLRSVLYDEPIPQWEPEISDAELEEYFEPLSYAKDKTCDIQFPEEVFGGEQIVLQYERLLKGQQK